MKVLVIFVKYIYLIFTVNSYQLNVLTERPQVEYVNPKYLEQVAVSMLRVNRTSPYIVNITFFPKVEIGDNLYFEAIVMEQLSSGYQPTLMRLRSKGCVFLNEEPLIGKMISKQLPPNVSCPIPKNVKYTFLLQAYPLEVPFEIPFTFLLSNRIKGRIDLSIFTTVTKEKVARGAFHITVTVNKTNKNI